MTQPKPVTVFDHPTVMMDTQYGRISHGQWCQKEIERMTAKGAHVVLIEEDGMVAVGRTQ